MLYYAANIECQPMWEKLGRATLQTQTGRRGAREDIQELLHHRCLLLADAGEAFLNQAREFFLAGELDLRVFLGHADGTVASDL
jgi:hypothetical protein